MPVNIASLPPATKLGLQLIAKKMALRSLQRKGLQPQGGTMPSTGNNALMDVINRNQGRGMPAGPPAPGGFPVGAPTGQPPGTAAASVPPAGGTAPGGFPSGTPIGQPPGTATAMAPADDQGPPPVPTPSNPGGPPMPMPGGPVPAMRGMGSASQMSPQQKQAILQMILARRQQGMGAQPGGPQPSAPGQPLSPTMLSILGQGQ